MITPPNDKDTPMTPDNEYHVDEIDENTDRVVMRQAGDSDLSDDDETQIAYAISDSDDEFRLDNIDDYRLDDLDDDESFDNDESQAADEELSIVNARDVGVGYGLDEAELAQLTGKPN